MQKKGEIYNVAILHRIKINNTDEIMIYRVNNEIHRKVMANVPVSFDREELKNKFNVQQELWM